MCNNGLGYKNSYKNVNVLNVLKMLYYSKIILYEDRRIDMITRINTTFIVRKRTL